MGWFRLDSLVMSLERPALLRAALLATLVGSPAGGDAPPEAALARGDAAWERRGEGRSALRAAPGPISEAVAAYGRALELLPDDLEVRWKLMRAIYYQGEYVLEDRSHRLAVFARGLDLGETGIDQLAAAAGGREALDLLDVAGVVRALEGSDHAAPVYFWSCIHWGLWGRETGKLAAVRRGVAGRLRHYSEIVIGLDEAFEDGGAHRILGRLHFEAPRLPFITGWIDPETARRSLERAAELAPEDPLSQLYLIEAIHEYDRSRRDEALERLRELVSRGPRPERPVEDAHALANARALLEQWTR